MNGTKLAEKWKIVPDYEDLEVSNQGNVRRIYKDEKRMLKPWLRSNGSSSKKQLVIRYSTGHQKYKDLVVARLVFAAFVGQIPEGACIVHKNGLHSDLSPQNLEAVERRDLGLRYARSARRRPVLKKNKNGKIIIYPSATAAAKDSYFCVQAITNYCNKKAVPIDGCTYRWDELP